MKNKRIVAIILTAVLALAIPLILAQCGGGGGSNIPAISSPSGSGSGTGKVAASVKLTGRSAGRSVAQTTATIGITITISGIYSETGEAFEPIVYEDTIDISQGQASVSVLDVPIGLNHLLVVEADWGAFVETIKTIILEVAEDHLETVIADQSTTVMADTAVYYAAQEGLELTDITVTQLNAWSMAIGSLSLEGTAYADMGEAAVINYAAAIGEPASVAVAPSSVMMAPGETYTFIIAVLDANGAEVADATATVALDPSTLGSIDDTGIFTASASGTVVLTATYDTFSASATIIIEEVVVAACGDSTVNTGEDCDDGNTTTETCIYGSMSCTVCDSTCTSVAGAVSYCGDGTTDTANSESCDDGPSNGLANMCNSTCDGTTPATCGNGSIESGETCDDTGESSTCNSDCSTAACGDGIINTSASETCDDTGESVSCNSDCTTAVCGDTIINTTAGEVCDGGGETSTCNSDCSPSVCGDTIINTTDGESCDDGGESSPCNSDCTLTSCGDGIANTSASETCDDGVNNGTNGFCNNTCDGTVSCTSTGGACSTDSECCGSYCLAISTGSTYTCWSYTSTSSSTSTCISGGMTYTTFPGPYTCQ